MYDMDLREVLWGSERVGVRRLYALVSNLPLDSATARALDLNKGWTQEDELLATIADYIATGNHLFLAANVSEKDRRALPQLVRFPRPWERGESAAGAVSSYDEVRAFFMNSDTGEVRVG